jgi:predicted metalloprotease with PDZ domain
VIKPYLLSSWPAALLVCAALGAAAPAAVLGADAPPAPPAPPAPAAPADSKANLEAQLEAARRELEQAAHEVARLSAELSGQLIDRAVIPYIEPHAIIGVQLERATGAPGARVREVSPGGPAAEAGIRPGDVITAVNGAELSSGEPTRQVVRIMRDVRPDTRVSVRVMRDGKVHDYLLTAREAPGPLDLPSLLDLPALPEVRGAFMFHRPLMDMELATLTPRLGSYFGSDKGVLVVRAPADGALKLEDGDVILAIDGREPTSGSHATRILGSYQPGEKIVLRILRQHKTLQLDATLPPNSGPARNADTLHLEGSRRDDGEMRQPPRVLINAGGDRT